MKRIAENKNELNDFEKAVKRLETEKTNPKKQV
jgi:hypothetical protein